MSSKILDNSIKSARIVLPYYKQGDDMYWSIAKEND